MEISDEMVGRFVEGLDWSGGPQPEAVRDGLRAVLKLAIPAEPTPEMAEAFENAGGAAAFAGQPGIPAGLRAVLAQLRDGL